MVYQTYNRQLIEYILTDPRLYKAAGAACLIPDFKADMSFTYLVIERDHKIVGCFQYRQVSDRLIECHINIMSSHWGIKDLSQDALIESFDWIRHNTNYYVAMTDVPTCCEQVKNLLEKLQARVCGLIPEGCTYKGQVQDLLLYTYKIRD